MNAQPVTHPAPEQLSAFGLGKLHETAAAAIAQHLADCATCRKALAGLPGDSFVGMVRAAKVQATVAPSSPTPAPKDKLTPPQPAAPPPELPPELAKHSKYRIRRELGRGGMGVVYQAEHIQMERLVAIKVINKSILEHPQALQRFAQEVRAAAKLSHPNIVAAFDFEQAGDLHMLVMEFVEGQNLAEIVERRGPLPLLNACHYVRQAALGLQHAHEQGMVHRDLKPQNLMLAPKGTVKLLDMGLARVEGEKSAQQKKLTSLGATLGTPEYMAPEQAMDAAKADIRSDIYSLGCTLYCLLAGRPPFVETTAVQMILAHLEKEPQPLPELRADVPEKLATVVARMMAKDPAQRYQKPVEVAQALAPFCKPGAKGVAAEPVPVAEPTAAVAARLAPPTMAVGSSAVLWDTLTDGDAAGKVVSAKKKTQKARSRPTGLAAKKKWLIGGAAAAVALLTFLVLIGLVGLWAAGMFKVKTKDGTIVLENLPPDADVTVDGGTVSVKSSDGKTFEVRVDPGKKHRLEVKKEGFKVFGDEVEVDTGGRKSVLVRLEPAGDPTKVLIGKGLAQKDTPNERNKRLALCSTKSEWSITDGELSQRNGSGPQFIIFGDPNWADYDFTFEVKKIGGSDLGYSALYHARDFQNYLAFEYGAYANGDWSEVQHVVQSKWGRGPDACKRVDNIVLNRWYNVHVAVRGIQIVCRLDGIKLHDYSDDHIVSGRVGLKTMTGAKLVFRNIKVTSPAGDVLWQGLPLLPNDGQGFVPLFNGKDLTGWKKNPDGPVNWDVQDGMIHTNGNGRIHTERDDYGNFHLRAELKVEPNCAGCVLIRSTMGPRMENSYNVVINTSSNKANEPRTGSLQVSFHQPEGQRLLKAVDDNFIKPNEWFVLEVVAEDNRFTVRVDGKEVLSVSDPDKNYARGHIALARSWTKGGEWYCRKIEIKELPPTKQSGQLPPSPSSLPQTQTVDLGGGVKMEFVLIPKGTFWMGSALDEKDHNSSEKNFDAEKLHEVEITKPFYLARYPVTQEQYVAITGKKNPSCFSRDGTSADRVQGLETKRFPVEEVSWNDAKSCCADMAKKDKQGRQFRLPSEAEWEYACRAGTKTAYFFGDDVKNLSEYAWFDSNSGGRTHEVGTKKPNAWGLYDMSGNVFQWCEDFYGPYEGLPERDPVRLVSDTKGHAQRGGSWVHPARLSRASYRSNFPPTSCFHDVGFRVAFSPQLDETGSGVGKPERQGFVPLFNGKDLAGWKTHPKQPGKWRVENGVLIGSGEAASHLYTERDDYKDFHLRVEARVNDKGNSGVYFRSQFGPRWPANNPTFPFGYEAEINNYIGTKTGSLNAGKLAPMVNVRESPVPPGKWFTLEVIAEGNHIVLKFDGNTTVDCTDDSRTFTRGHIALQNFERQTVCEFRKIEIKELPSK